MYAEAYGVTSVSSHTIIENKVPSSKYSVVSLTIVPPTLFDVSAEKVMLLLPP